MLVAGRWGGVWDQTASTTPPGDHGSATDTNERPSVHSKDYSGHRRGYTFKLGDDRLGYYADRNTAIGTIVRTLVLDDLILCSPST